MIAVKENIEGLLTASAPSPRLMSVDQTKEHRTRRRVWRQILKFVLACMQVKRNDLSLATWHRLEYRNEYRVYDRSREQTDYRFL